MSAEDQETAADQPGLLIVGHGTRDVEGQGEFRALTALLSKACPERLVESCFLELVEPSIETGLARLAERGLGRRLTVVPLLLFAAGHAKRDIPEAVMKAAGKFASRTIAQAAPLGCASALIELSRRRYLEALQGKSAIDEAETLLLMTGRGSLDPDANSEMARFARLRWEAQPVGWLETCYTAMTPPSLEQALEIAARLPFKRVVVQPHLLFRGELTSRVRRTVEGAAERHPGIDWLVVDHLGPDPLVCEAILRAVHAAESGRAG